jgi:hypothetical protein
LKIEHKLVGSPTFLGLSWKHKGRFNGTLLDPAGNHDDRDSATEDIFYAKNEDGTHQLRYYIRTTWLRHSSITRYSWVYHSPILDREFIWTGIDLPDTFPWKDLQ